MEGGKEGEMNRRESERDRRNGEAILEVIVAKNFQNG